MNFELLSLSAEDAASFYHLPKISHKDPFDRMLIAQGIADNCPIMTDDPKIAMYDCQLF